MSKPEFVYTTYIETAAEKLWHALTDGDFHERYWFGHRAVSDWQIGSPYTFSKQGKPSVQGKVLYRSHRKSSPTPGIPARRMPSSKEPSGLLLIWSRVAR